MPLHAWNSPIELGCCGGIAKDAPEDWHVIEQCKHYTMLDLCCLLTRACFDDKFRRMEECPDCLEINCCKLAFTLIVDLLFGLIIVLCWLISFIVSLVLIPLNLVFGALFGCCCFWHPSKNIAYNFSVYCFTECCIGWWVVDKFRYCAGCGDD